MTNFWWLREKWNCLRWHLERLLRPSSIAHIQTLGSHPASVSVTAHGHTEETGGNKYINIEMKSESKRRGVAIPPLSSSLCQRNGCQDINFNDVRNLGGGVGWGGGESSVVADYCCLCVCLCVRVFPPHFYHLTKISSPQTAWEAV